MLALIVRFTLLSVAKTMSSVSTMTPSEPPGSPEQRLQKLLAVPGAEPSRVNDLLLLRPEAATEPGEGRGNSHVVFFHGDIQVSGMERTHIISSVW